MADAYGLNDFTLLSGPQQDTARTIQRAFDASTAARSRMLERYNLQTYGPMLTEFANDAALKRAQTTAGLLNNNQQLQNLIDESHRTPHGLAENLSAYLPMLGGAARLYPMLFGTNIGLAKNGLIPSAYNAVKGWYNNPSSVGNEAGWPGELPGYQYTPSGTQPLDFGSGSVMPYESDWSGWNVSDFDAGGWSWLDSWDWSF